MKAFAILDEFNPATNKDVALSKFLLGKFPGCFITHMVATEDYFTQLKKLNLNQVLPLDTRIQLFAEALPRVDNFQVIVQPWLQLADNINVLRNSLGFMFGGFQLVLEEDKVSELHIWENWQEIVVANKFLVVTKDEKSAQLPEEVKQFADNFEFVERSNVPLSISSVEIRDAYYNDNLDSVKDSIPDNVYKYLTETEGLFGRVTEQADN